MDSLHIDGTLGEGGGQVLRTAAGMAARTGRPIEVSGIRQDRHKAGLRPQHVAALEAVAQACNGELSGAEVGASHIDLVPGQGYAHRIQVETGTAANTVLILQALIPLAPALEEPLILEAHGGTDTKWAPTLGFLERVLVPLAARAGTRVEILSSEEGFYPKGGGSLSVALHPRDERRWPTPLETRGELLDLEVILRISQLPEHVAERTLVAACGPLDEAGYEVKAASLEVHATSPGVVIDGVAVFEDTVLGANALGEKGLPSETLGQRLAEDLLAELQGAGTVDVHAADQLVPLLFDQPGAGFLVREVTSHLETNLAVVDRFLPGGYEIEPVGGGARVSFQPG